MAEQTTSGAKVAAAAAAGAAAWLDVAGRARRSAFHGGEA